MYYASKVCLCMNCTKVIFTLKITWIKNKSLVDPSQLSYTLISITDKKWSSMPNSVLFPF